MNVPPNPPGDGQTAVDPRLAPGHAPQGHMPPQAYAHPPQYAVPGAAEQVERFARRHLRTPETKPFFFTSEFYVWLITAISVLIAGAVSHGFRANQVWAMVGALSIGYMLSRGIAKSGARRSEPEDN